jgi:benzoyl-CoA reductase/2-hydroxyglutaryl-CoA dehydratase subunit BcrC/BadD/HgdB
MMMNFLEEQVALMERRLRKIKDNPDPTKLQTNLMLYELELDLRKNQAESWKEEKNFACAVGMAPILRSLGFVYLDLHQISDRVKDIDKYMGWIQSHGYPQEACDRTVTSVSMPLLDDVPKPSFVVSSNWACTPLMLMMNAIGYELDIPKYFIDIPASTDEPSEELLEYVTNQLVAMIEYVEKNVAGAKYDESKLVELQEWDKIAFGYLHEIYEFRARIPTPMRGQDTFRLPRLPSFYPNPPQVIEYFKHYREEVKRRAAEGRGVVEDEKLRVLWTVSAPYGRDVFRILEERGASMPHFQFGVASRYMGAKHGVYGDQEEFGRKLTPLEEEARMMLFNSWAGLGRRWVNDTTKICRDLHIDAIVNFEQEGCVAAAGLRKLLEDGAKEELGIPTLNIEGRNLFTDKQEQKHFDERLSVFIDNAIEKKHKKAPRF